MSKYLATVAKSGQVNTPPGSYLTVKEWARNAFMDRWSTLLEIGCSTGFISIEMARYVGATCVGLDLHEGSIAAARQNVDRHVAHLLSFQQGDAGKLPFADGQFSHVVVSGHLPFIPPEERRGHVIEALRVVKPWGYLLTALYHYRTPPPEALVEEFNAKIGTRLSPDGTKAYWAGLFDELPLTLEYETEYEAVPADEVRAHQYVGRMRPETRDDWKEYVRLFNENGRFLNYSVRVHRKIPAEPDLMLQIPRGGIYGVRRKPDGGMR
ncbi:class I SAM-dependent methyltransferase [Patescibacteria group bacterium]|nr:MAG: class I SAM-dependent methyltransferase [Patescibacteria group bacterium]